ncbi:MAG: hypothetical protein ACE5EQ_00380 [Phycisphaerae bacterium]
MDGSGNRIARRALIIAVLCACLIAAPVILAQPVVMSDPANDALLRKTDDNADGFIDPQVQRLPEILEMRIGTYQPIQPDGNRFIGNWDSAGGYLRLDIDLAGIINPPGPLGLDTSFPSYDPLLYGPNPVYGFIEFDIDEDENTGGELSAPDFRYLGNVARFGGLPVESRFTNRVALDASAFDGDVTTPPFVDRSGEEFHISFLGERISSVDVDHESPGGDPALFEAGETWFIGGKLVHRAHGFEQFTLMCFNEEGRYEDEVKIQFKHDLATDITMISLVYPLTNAGSAAFSGPNETVLPNDGCADGQSSIEEALEDLQFSATIAPPGTRQLPEFQLIAGWEFNNVADHLDPANWRVTGLLGSAYVNQQPDAALFIWTDLVPNPQIGDFNADGLVDAADTAQLNAYIATDDGTSNDEDGIVNNSIDLWNFAGNFSLFDTDYDGLVAPQDAIVPGDMDLNQLVEFEDIDDFVLALLDPAAYSATHGGVDPLIRGDLNVDGLLDGREIQGFLTLIVGP